MNTDSFIVQYYDYYGVLLTATLSSPTISTIIPNITYSATYSQVATLLSLHVQTSIESSGASIGTTTLSALIDTTSTTELQIVVLPTAPETNPQPSQTSPATSGNQKSSTALHGGAIAGITIGATVGSLSLLVLGWYLLRRRRHPSPSSPHSGRTVSRAFEKPELEGSTPKGPLSELPGSEGARNDGITNVHKTKEASTHQELEAFPVSHPLD